MNSEIIQVTVWWLMFFILGTSAFPLTFLLFSKFRDRGYLFAKLIGLLVPAYTIFVINLLKLLPLTLPTILAAIFIFALFNLYLLKENLVAIKQFLSNNIRLLAVQEIVFTLGYLLWVIVRGYQPDVNGLEKFMDLGFINSILRSTYLPPVDMWASGEIINYYWFGHYLTALLTKISHIPSSITYNLMLATILGLALSFTSSIVYNLISHLNKKINWKKACLFGLLSAVLLTFGGNFHTPWQIMQKGADSYWYPDATRFIGYNPETDDKTIHEFPLYSFVVSDLHAHLINLPLVLLYLALLWRLLTTFEKKKERTIANIVPNGFLIGIMFMTSAWDFANYSLLTGVALLLFMFSKHRFKIDTILETSKYIFVYLLVGILTVAPFMINFESIAQGVDLVNARTPLWQLGVLWGFPAVFTIIFMIVLARIKKVKQSDLFVVALLITGWFLIVIPEIVYVKDIYISSHHRANTMFKLTYQAFVMFYLSVGYIVYRSITSIKDAENRIVVSLFYFVLFVGILSYPYFAVRSYYYGLKDYRGISGETWIQKSYPGYYDAIIWLRENIEGQPVILEAQGDSYTEYNMISAYTGLPTINGWYVHEWLWRGSSEFPQLRANDITQIYASSSIPETIRLLEKYNVEYVVIGRFEREKYLNIDENKFEQIGRLVFTSEDLKIYEIN